MDTDLISTTPPQVGAPNVDAVYPDKIIPTDMVQIYDEMPAPVRHQHALANWTSVRLGNHCNAKKGKEEETGEQSQIMMIADSNTIDL